MAPPGQGIASEPKNISAMAGPMKAALGPKRRLTYHAVFSVAEAAIHSGAAARAAADLVSYAALGGADGLLCDYEPADNYTVAHAAAYGGFLDALAAEAHAHGLEVGFDVAGWGILDFWHVWEPLRVDFMTSMSPTYSAKSVPTDEAFVTEMVGAVGHARAAVGVGSIPAPGHEDKCSNMKPYLWNGSSFAAFTGWLRDTAGVQDLDVWRCDIDHYGETAGWFIAAVAAFVGRG